MRKTIAHIHLNAIKNNYLYAKSCANNKNTIAIIKADGYGHGAVAVAKKLANVADGFGVSCLEEALELRENGVKKPILLLEGLFEFKELSLVIQHNLQIVVANFEQIQWLESTNHCFDIFLKLDTGMHRLGFNSSEILTAYQLLKTHNITLMSHFSDAEINDKIISQRQIQQLNIVKSKFNLPVSFSNSAGILQNLNLNETTVRPGIMLYGAAPIEKYQKNLTPAMSLTAPIIAIRDLSVGDKVGYNGTFECQKPSKIGTVAIGYADGYPRHTKNDTPVFINGETAKLAGRVSMDMITIDLTGISNVKLGDKVELFGNNISINQLAQSADTNSYEILTKINKRVYRIFE